MSIAHLPVGHARRGMTLVVVLIALVILGSLVAGVFVASWREYRGATAAVERARAFAAAEHGLYVARAAEHWDSRWNTRLAPALLASIHETLDGNATDTLWIWKLTPWSALAIADGVARRADFSIAARRRLALLLALRSPTVPRVAAVMTRDGVSVRDASSIIGTDTVENSDDCSSADSAVAAVAVADRSLIDTAACGSTPCLVGSPPVVITVQASSPGTYERFGQVDRSNLTTTSQSFPPGAELSPHPVAGPDGECNSDAPGNLGDPSRVLGTNSPCASYFPVHHAQGDLLLSGGAGQGMLLVDGDLTLVDGARFSGVVVARGTVRLDNRSRLEGMLLAARVTVDGASTIDYSPCTVDRALTAAARPVPVPGQSWTEMF